MNVPHIAKQMKNLEAYNRKLQNAVRGFTFAQGNRKESSVFHHELAAGALAQKRECSEKHDSGHSLFLQIKELEIYKVKREYIEAEMDGSSNNCKVG